MINKLWNVFVPSRMIFYPDEVSGILAYHQRVQRTDPLRERFTESSAVRHVVNLEYANSGYLKIQLEINREDETRGGFSICDIRGKCSTPAGR
jgi:hypothetical protein